LVSRICDFYGFCFGGTYLLFLSYMSSAVIVKNLSKTYPVQFPRIKTWLGLKFNPPVQALKNVSFEIQEGEIFGLIGRNGAGKTTLTKIIATLVQPTSGQVLVKGFDSVKDEVKVRELIGLAVAEERSFYWRLTCEQNMMFFARLYGMSDKQARKKTQELFERLGLTELARRRFLELSTGNKQRLAVARALLADPQILLLDEPTRSLDPLAAAQMRALISNLKNVSILLTSHNLSEVEELCDRVAVISHGEIRDVDTPSNLRLRHKQTQKVTIIFSHKGGLPLPPMLNQAQLEEVDSAKKISFFHEIGDELLNDVLVYLINNGAKIRDVETSKGTLLDVLETLERNN
jgi:ABC-2 type transport system ATP-binding protein